MKRFLFLLLIFLSVNLFAFGEKDIIKDLTQNSSIIQNGQITFNANLLKGRVYILKAEGEAISQANVTSLYKFATVNEYSLTLTNNETYFAAPVRQDNTQITLPLANISKITLHALEEPQIYGVFIIPQYKNTVTKSTKRLIFRYFSNHEELGKNDSEVNIYFTIKDTEGNVKWNKEQKGTLARGFYSFDKPKLSDGNYTFTCETKSGDAVLGTYSCQLNYGEIKDDLYPDENGRLWWKGNMFVMLGLMGNYDKSEININTYVENNTLNIFGEDSAIPLYMPQSFVNTETFKDNRHRLSVCDNVETSLFAIINSDYFGLRLQDNVYEKIQELFDSYGFYYPLINIIDVNDNLNVRFWETFAQTQTGFIFNIQDPSHIAKIKPYIDFIKKYENIILSNEEPKTHVFGNIKFLLRRAGKEEYAFLMETRGKECETDILVPNKKNKVYDTDTLLESDKKQKNKYTLTLNPYEIKVIRVEL